MGQRPRSVKTREMYEIAGLESMAALFTEMVQDKSGNIII
jgi:hypothetical protein